VARENGRAPGGRDSIRDALAVCFPGMVYRVMNPNLTVADETYPSLVGRGSGRPAGVVAAAVLGRSCPPSRAW